MSTDAASLTRARESGRVEELFEKLFALTAGLLGGGALVYFAWNWGLAPAITNLRPLDGFWMGPMFVTAIYFLVVVVKAVLSDEVSIDIDRDDFNKIADRLVPLAGLLVLFWAAHHYLL